MASDMTVDLMVHNLSSEFVECFVSRYTSSGSHGSDQWFPLPPDGHDTWKRKAGGWEFVVFRLPGSGESPPRAGKYIQITPISVVQFHGFDDIRVLGPEDMTGERGAQ